MTEKRVPAWWLRQRTMEALRWLSEHLARGHFTRVSHAISQIKHYPELEHERIKHRLLQAMTRHKRSRQVAECKNYRLTPQPQEKGRDKARPGADFWRLKACYGCRFTP